MNISQQFEPKYKKILAKLIQRLEGLSPGTRLPTVRQLMAEYQASQAAIERCLDELVRRGQVKRRQGSGLFVDGIVPKSSLLGLYTDGQGSAITHGLFLQGARAAAAKHGFQVADFGPTNFYENPKKTLSEIEKMGFAGIITALSIGHDMNIEENRELADYLRRIHIPLVTCRPLPAIQADSVTPDYFTTFQKLGKLLRNHISGQILFLGYQGVPSLARMSGLRSGLGKDVQFDVELLDGYKECAYKRVKELKKKGYKGTLVIGVPPDEPGIVRRLENVPWHAGTGNELLVVLETNQGLPNGVSAHVVLKPSFRMGEAAARILIKRVQGFRGDMRHEVIRHEVRMVKAILRK